MKFGHYSNEELGIRRDATGNMFAGSGYMPEAPKDIFCSRKPVSRKATPKFVDDEYIEEIEDFGDLGMCPASVQSTLQRVREGKDPDAKTVEEWCKQAYNSIKDEIRSRIADADAGMRAYGFPHEDVEACKKAGKQALASVKAQLKSILKSNSRSMSLDSLDACNDLECDIIHGKKHSDAWYDEVEMSEASLDDFNSVGDIECAKLPQHLAKKMKPVGFGKMKPAGVGRTKVKITAEPSEWTDKHQKFLDSMEKSARIRKQAFVDTMNMDTYADDWLKNTQEDVNKKWDSLKAKAKQSGLLNRDMETEIEAFRSQELGTAESALERYGEDSLRDRNRIYLSPQAKLKIDVNDRDYRYGKGYAVLEALRMQGYIEQSMDYTPFEDHGWTAEEACQALEDLNSDFQSDLKNNVWGLEPKDLKRVEKEYGGKIQKALKQAQKDFDAEQDAFMEAHPLPSKKSATGTKKTAKKKSRSMSLDSLDACNDLECDIIHGKKHSDAWYDEVERDAQMSEDSLDEEMSEDELEMSEDDLDTEMSEDELECGIIRGSRHSKAFYDEVERDAQMSEDSLDEEMSEDELECANFPSASGLRDNAKKAQFKIPVRKVLENAKHCGSMDEAIVNEIYDTIYTSDEYDSYVTNYPDERYYEILADEQKRLNADIKANVWQLTPRWLRTLAKRAGGRFRLAKRFIYEELEARAEDNAKREAMRKERAKKKTKPAGRATTKKKTVAKGSRSTRKAR